MTKKMETKTEDKSSITRRKSTQYVKFCAKDERNASFKKVSLILQKAENERTVEDEQVLCQYSEIVTDLKSRWEKRDRAKQRLEEVEEPMSVLEEKCKLLAQAIANAEHLVIYTGAGISTAARIPDYRGTNGIWTRLQQGKDIGNHDLSLAEPTFTHMALSELYHRKILKYVVSQNCDGLHLRSGLSRSALSELHGNMYIEVCKNCKPAREYWRLFDVTENTARFSHKTMRRCYICSHELVDTIVHFGERGTLQWPLNWSGACKNADAADTILCLGSSLKVLKRYPWLWQMNKPAKKRPNLYIVNLQWTPKDDCSVMKIHGKCDVIMKQVIKLLGIDVPGYNREKDPIFAHATLLTDLEMHTTSQPLLKTIEAHFQHKKDSNIKTEMEENIGESKTETEENNVETEEKSNLQSEVKENKEIKVKTELKDEEECESKIKKEISSDREKSSDIIKKENNVKKEADCPNSNKNNDKEEVNDSENDIDSSIYLLKGEQDHAYDLTVHRKSDSTDENKKSLLLGITTNCDNTQNTHSSIKTARLSQLNGSSSINCTLSEQTNSSDLPPKRKSPHYFNTLTNSTFSIDSILNKSNEVKIIKPNTTGQNIQTIMAYYEFANSLLQNQMLSYLSSGFYPYQTSFLYPGLHSIINPVPYFNYDFNCSTADKPNNNQSRIDCNKTVTVVKEEVIAKPSVPSCTFCYETFNAYICLYYARTESVFIKQLHRFSKSKNCNKPLICVCCDYSTEEDSDSDDDNNENKIDPKKKIKRSNSKCDEEDEEKLDSECTRENIDETNICEDQATIKHEKTDGKTAKIQAGWFGKGYRKNRKLKRKQYSNSR